MKRILTVLLLVALALVYSVSLVQAGGWAVVSLVHLPRSLEAGRMIELEFRVLQHGVTPAPNLETYIEAQHAKSGDKLKFEGQYDSLAELYRTEVSFPYEGAWEWKVVAFGDHPMPALNISPNAKTAASQTGAGWWQGWFDNIFGRKQTVQAEPAIVQMYATDEDYGAALFVAKGCIMCHVHSENPFRSIEGSFGYNGTPLSFGPVLTDFSSSAEYLRLWLSDPASVKPETKMPDLDLSDSEMAALIAFLNAD